MEALLKYWEREYKVLLDENKRLKEKNEKLEKKQDD